MRNQEHQCSICNYEWITVYKGVDLFDKNGNKIKWRENCPNCGYTPRLTSQEIGVIIASAK